MSVRREAVVRENLERTLAALAEGREDGVAPAGAPGGPPPAEALAVVEAALTSRLLDLEARRLKDEGLGYYTIGSAGHEANGVLGRLLRASDPCLLHYRSGAFMAARCRDLPGSTFIHDTLLSFCASAEDPVSGGMHKVWGHPDLWVPPQTSTIASHLPKAVGLAFAVERARHLMREGKLSPADLLPTAHPLPEDAIVCCSFGDASLNHASACTAFNAAAWAAYQHLPVPLLFVCEDNGLGISVHTPEGWIEERFRRHPAFDYFAADGGDLEECWRAAGAAVAACRARRRPTFLHLRVVRLLGHAGSDVEQQYSSETDILAREARDPLPAMCRLVVRRGWIAGRDLLALYRGLEERIRRVARRAAARPKVRSLAEIRRWLEFPPAEAAEGALRRPAPDERRRAFGGRLPEEDRPRHMAFLLSRALSDLMLAHPEILVFGEDVARKGGVYHVTADLFERFGPGRVFNTLLDETMILGLAIGAAQAGFLPIPEIQYLAYLHNAEDQLRGEACSQRFFSRGAFANPMVVRIASFAYQKGFGGHFHNDDSIAVLRDIPGLVIAVPARGDDAVTMLRACVAAARGSAAVCAFLEPIALYMQRDLYEAGDGAWACRYPEPGEVARIGEPRFHGDPEDCEILVATYGNGVPLSLRARRAAGLEERAAVMDLRWLAPLPIAAFVAAARRARAVLVVDECRRSGGGPAEALLAALAEDPEARKAAVRRVTAADSYVPLGPGADLVLPGPAEIAARLSELAAEGARR